LHNCIPVLLSIKYELKTRVTISKWSKRAPLVYSTNQRKIARLHNYRRRRRKEIGCTTIGDEKRLPTQIRTKNKRQNSSSSISRIRRSETNTIGLEELSTLT
jgi:hypothetical protein